MMRARLGRKLRRLLRAVARATIVSSCRRPSPCTCSGRGGGWSSSTMTATGCGACRLKGLMSVTVFVGLVALASSRRAIWSVADLSLSAENAHLIDHPTRLWVQAPNARFNLPEHGELRTNALGLRDGAVTIPKPRGEHRILSLGESSTWGHGVRQSDTYSTLLERMLTTPSRIVNVINAGVPAYTIQQSAVYLAEEGARLQPNVVMVYHQTNDFLPSGGIDTHNPLVRLTASDRELIRRRRPLAPVLRVSSPVGCTSPCETVFCGCPLPFPRPPPCPMDRCGSPKPTAARPWIPCCNPRAQSGPRSRSFSPCTRSTTPKTGSCATGVPPTSSCTSRPTTFAAGWGATSSGGSSPMACTPDRPLTA